MDSLPPDPYKALGVGKDADLAAIRSAHRKLVLKCHPDKVQDPQLKAIKQDEFQTVQQAYELLSDDKRRTAYDEKVKLFELRREMGRGGAGARPDPFQYEVRNAEPRTSSTTYTRQPVYTSSPPRSYEDVAYSERGVPRKSTTYEPERKRNSIREEDERERRRRYEDEERSRQKSERKAEKIIHSDKKKSRDKERRRGTEEKTRTRVSTAYVEDESSEGDYRDSRYEKRSSKRRSEEEMRMREEAARQEGIREERERMFRQVEIQRQKEIQRAAIRSADLDPKWDKHQSAASQYIKAANGRRREDSGHMEPHPGIRRAETFAAPSQKYRVAYAANAPYISDDEDSPRRSSGRRETRRASEAPIMRQESLNREKSSKSSRRVIPDPYIVEPPSPPPPTVRKPTLQTHSSAPPNISSFRKEPVRSKTQDYPRTEKAPSLPRAATFAPGDRGRGGSSKLRREVHSEDSDSDEPTYSPRRSSPPPPRKSTEPVRYSIINGRSVPITARTTDHRADLQDPYDRDRSESPRGSSRQERPSVPRASSERPRAVPIRTQSQAYYGPPAGSRADPIIVDAIPSRPKLARENSRSNVHSTSPRASSSSGGAYMPAEVKYGPQYGHESVNYSSYPPGSGGDHAYSRRGSEGIHVVHGHHGGSRDYSSYNTSRGGRQQVYT